MIRWDIDPIFEKVVIKFDIFGKLVYRINSI